VEDVQAVDVRRFDDGYGPGEGLVFDFEAEGVALVRGELFGVVEEWVAVVWWEDDGCSDDGACEWPAAGFVASGFEASLYE
jgi:hypothetical protein